MSATAHAAGNPSGDRPGRRPPPPPRKDLVPLAVRGPRPPHHPHAGGGAPEGAGRPPRAQQEDPPALRRSQARGGTLQAGRRDGAAASLRTGPPAHGTGSAPGPATGERPTAEARTTRTTTASVRPARAHTAPVRTGSLRSRTAASPTQAPGPAPRIPSGSPASRLRSAVGTHRAPLVLLVVTLLVATTLGLLFLNTAIAVNSLKATQLAAANQDRAEEVQRLEQQVIAGGTPAELAREARQAGMVPAGPAAYLVVGEDGTVTLRGEAVPAEQPEPSEVPVLPAPPAAGPED
jgi:hypothetical protein